MTQQIDTSKYIKGGAVVVDGNEWAISLPGAGRELQYSKAQRRMALLNKKVVDGTATEEDLDKLDSFEDNMLEFFVSIFKDSTPDNSEVRQWINDTPTTVIIAAFEDVKKAASEQDGSI